MSVKFSEIPLDALRPLPEQVMIPHYVTAEEFERIWSSLLGRYLAINVWNCEAHLVIAEIGRYFIKFYRVTDLPDKVKEAVVKCVESQGGALNISGLYRACPELIELIRRLR